LFPQRHAELDSASAEPKTTPRHAELDSTSPKPKTTSRHAELDSASPVMKTSLSHKEYIFRNKLKIPPLGLGDFSSVSKDPESSSG